MSRQRKPKKAAALEHPKVFEHVGLLFNGPPDKHGLPFIESSNAFESFADRSRKLPYAIQPAAMMLYVTEPTDAAPRNKRRGDCQPSKRAPSCYAS